MRPLNRAFTLIELLVVIAIIAILAAILFPVFAQAKAAAKHAVTLSNCKQVALGIKLYIGDYDDMYPLRGTTNGDGNSWATGACNADAWGCPSWDKLIYPYSKNYELMKSGIDRTPVKPSNIGDIKRSFSAAKYVFRSVGGIPPWWGGAPSGVNKPTFSESSVPSPSGTILFTEHRNWLGTFSGDWWIWSTFWEMWVWGEQAKNTLDGTVVMSIDPAFPHDGTSFYAGVDYSNANKAAFVFADGSVKTHTKGYIFPGHERRLSVAHPVDNTIPGVCIDSDGFTADTSKDCKLPE